MNKPIVSVILPVYNSARYVEKAIESVLQQTLTNLELIIINDGSTDNSQKIIESFHDPRIKIIKQENKGLIATLNIGVAFSCAENIARIDADDIWSNTNKLSKQIEYFSKNPTYVVLGTWANIIDKDDNNTSFLTYPETDTEIRNKILTKNCFIHPSVVFKKETFLKAGGYDEQEKYVEDYGLWLRMGQFGKFANIPEPLMSYRVHQGGVTQQKNFVQSQNSLKIIKKYQSAYPNYYRGYLKWNLKLFLLKIIGYDNFNRLKK